MMMIFYFIHQNIKIKYFLLYGLCISYYITRCTNAMMDARRAQFKQGASTVCGIRTKGRARDIEERRGKRAEALQAKRIRRDIDYTNDSSCCSVTPCSYLHNSISDDGDNVVLNDEMLAKIGELTADLRHCTKGLASLSEIRRFLSRGEAFVDAFLAQNNVVDYLRLAINGSSSDGILDAVWCVSNIAASTSEHTKIALEFAPELIILLSGGIAELQDQAAWALGNIAGDGTRMRDTLLAQGILKPMISLLESPSKLVVRSAAFALSNLCRGSSENSERAVATIMSSASSIIMRWLADTINNVEIVTELAWVIFYLTSGERGREHGAVLMQQGLAEYTVRGLVGALHIVNPDVDIGVQENWDVAALLIPLLRCLGNLASGPDTFITELLRHSGFIESMVALARLERRNLSLEALWVLSNVAAGPVEHAHALVVGGAVTACVHGVLNGSFGIQKEAAYALINISYHGSEFMNVVLQAPNAVEGLVNLCRRPGMPELAILSMQWIELVLRTVDGSASKLERIGVIDALETFQFDRNEELRYRANYLVDTYYGEDYVEAHNENIGQVQDLHQAHNLE